MRSVITTESYLAQPDQQISSQSGSVEGIASYFPLATFNWLPYLLLTSSPSPELLSLIFLTLSVVAVSRFWSDRELLIRVSKFLMAPDTPWLSPAGDLFTSCLSIQFRSSFVISDLTTRLNIVRKNDRMSHMSHLQISEKILLKEEIFLLALDFSCFSFSLFVLALVLSEPSERDSLSSNCFSYSFRSSHLWATVSTSVVGRLMVECDSICKSLPS